MILPCLLSCLLAAFAPVSHAQYSPVLAALGDVPYIVPVYDVINVELTGVFKREFKCVAAIVSSEYVVTTATCLRTANFANAMAVAPSLLDQTDKGATFHNITETIEHENFTYWGKENDIALLKVTPPFTWSSAVAAIGFRKEAATSGTVCRISGWKSDMVTVDATLSYGNASLFDQSACFYLYGKKGFLCAGVPKDQKVGCLLGDDGGPLVCGGLLTGLFNYNMNTCFDPPEHGIYTDIVYQKAWLESKLPNLE